MSNTKALEWFEAALARLDYQFALNSLSGEQNSKELDECRNAFKEAERALSPDTVTLSRNEVEKIYTALDRACDFKTNCGQLKMMKDALAILNKQGERK